jgi:hypothetical protein
MVFHMKTTLNISDVVMKQLKEAAAQKGKTISELVELALRSMLRKQDNPGKLQQIPSFDGGEFLVDVSNRNSLYDTMDNS